MDFGRTPATWTILIIIVVVSGIGLMGAPRIIERNLLRPYRVVRRYPRSCSQSARRSGQ